MEGRRVGREGGYGIGREGGREGREGGREGRKGGSDGRERGREGGVWYAKRGDFRTKGYAAQLCTIEGG